MERNSMYRTILGILGFLYIVAYFMLVNHIENTGFFMLVIAAIYLLVSHFLKKK